MLTQEENSLLAQTGPGTRCGDLLRRYWQPAALSEELPHGGPPIPVRLLGEDLVLFRDDRERPGLLDRRCSHRGTDLSYGCVEEGGLRCPYHGWLYDVSGICLEQPGEPPGSDFKSKIRHPAYRCQEVAGIIFTYMGPGEPPLLPAYEFLTVPEAHRFLPTKSLHECNYLQGNEGNLDPGHTPFLHRFHESASLVSSGNRALQSRALQNLFSGDLSPTIEVEQTDFGLRVYTIRNVGSEQIYLRITNFIMPNLCAIGGLTSPDGDQADWHVPIDDTHHWKYTMAFKRSAPLMDREMKELRTELTADYSLIRNLRNRYLQDREEMKSRTFSGLGTIFQVHDNFAAVSQGPIQNRVREHLGTNDKAIVMARLLLLRAIRNVEQGCDPLHVIRDPNVNQFPHLVVKTEVVPKSTDWRNYWR